MTNLIENQNKLQNQALEVIEKLNLKYILGKYGEFRLVGSIEYGLMIWRDIDVNLVMHSDPTDNEYWDIVRAIFILPNVIQLTLADNRKQLETNRPRSMYLGIRYSDDINDIWKIDIRLLAKESVTTDRIAKLIHSKLTDESREIILQIKYQVYSNPKYHKEFSSVDVYEAVLSHNVKDLSNFEEYLSKLGKSL